MSDDKMHQSSTGDYDEQYRVTADSDSPPLSMSLSPDDDVMRVAGLPPLLPQPRLKVSIGEDSAYVTGPGSAASLSSSDESEPGRYRTTKVADEWNKSRSEAPELPPSAVGDSSKRRLKKKSCPLNALAVNDEEYSRLALSDDESVFSGSQLSNSAAKPTTFVAPSGFPPNAAAAMAATMIPVTGSNRRRLGQKRTNAATTDATSSSSSSTAVPSPRSVDIKQPNSEHQPNQDNPLCSLASKRRGSTPDSPRRLQRAPSSLFYLTYDNDNEDEDDDDDDNREGMDDDDDAMTKRRRLPRNDLPTSRKMSAAPYVLARYSQNVRGTNDDDNQTVTSPAEMEGAADLGNKEKKTMAVPYEEYYEETLRQIDAITKVFRLSDDKYREIKVLLNNEMDRGLGRTTHSSATVKMFHTHVRALPDGSEHGRFVALDLGGTNFRVLLVDLNGRETPIVNSKLYLVPLRIMLGTGQMLFDHIVKCIAEFLDANGLKSERLPLGFTFSFPCIQDGLASARLVRWTKGFKCSGVENENVVSLLHDAIRRRGDLNVECVAIINDNVGVLMAGAHSDANCRIGLILGTGTNCCYLEDLDKIEMWEGGLDEPCKMIVNTEWGAFGDDGALNFVRSHFDRILDLNSLNPGHQIFEKMISGMYMGEIVRLVLCDLALRGLIFNGRLSEELFESQRFYTKYISEIESDDPTGSYPNTRMVLQELVISDVTRDDCRHVQHVCWQVSQRAAFLAATAIAVVIERLDMDDVTVAVDGSLYRFHPHFKDLMNAKIAQLVRPQQRFKLILANDGSGQGAALVAAIAAKASTQQQHRHHHCFQQQSSSSADDNNNSNDNDTILMIY